MSSATEAEQQDAPVQLNRVKPVPRPGTWISAAVALVLGAMLAHALLTNEKFHWDTVWFFFREVRVVQAVGITLLLTFLAMVIGITLAVTTAIMRQSSNPVLRWASLSYLWLFRGTPIYTQASVDPGQSEAAGALGMSKGQILRRIVLPQAMRVIVPPTGNETISMLKTTSLVLAVPYTLDLTFVTNSYASTTYQTIPLLIVAALWYIIITSILMVGQHYIERYYGKGFDGPRRIGRKKSRGLSARQQAILDTGTTSASPAQEVTP